MNCQHCGAQINSGEITYAFGERIICHGCYAAFTSPPPQQMATNISYPHHFFPSAPPNAKYVQTIEKTAKFWKLQMLIAGAAVVLGLIIFAEGMPDQQTIEIPGLLIALGGAIWLVVIKFKIWWHHG